MGWAVLRVNIQEDGEKLLLGLEGRLVGPWVEELRSVWRQRVGTSATLQVIVDLGGLAAMDTSGRDLLEEMLQQGATLHCSDVMNQYLVEQMKSAGGRMEETSRPCQRFPDQSDSNEKAVLAEPAAGETIDAA